MTDAKLMYMPRYAEQFADASMDYILLTVLAVGAFAIGLYRIVKPIGFKPVYQVNMKNIIYNTKQSVILN